MFKLEIMFRYIWLKIYECEKIIAEVSFGRLCGNIGKYKFIV